MKILFKMTVMQFKMLLRNRGLLVGSLGLAVVSMLIFGMLFGGDQSRAARIGVADLDRSPVSQGLVEALRASPALEVTPGDEAALVDGLRRNQHAAVVVIEPGFGAALMSGGGSRARLYVDDSDLIGAARTRGIVLGVFDAAGKEVTGYSDPIAVAEERVSARRVRTIDFLTPGMLGLTIMFANMFVGISLIEWRERGTLKRLGATPLRAWQLIGAQMLSHLALSFAQVAIILAVAYAVFGVAVELSWLPAIATLVAVGTFSIIALGYAVGNFVQKRQAAQSVVTLIAMPMMFLAGSYFPVDAPSFLAPLVDVLPLTHLNRALREVMINDAGFDAIWGNIAALLALGAALLALSLRTFRWSWSR